MGKINNSPLIEAIFELRWGERQPGNFDFSRDEVELLPGVFSHALKEFGYGFTERPDPNAPDLPGLVKYRFRQAPNKWPCFQLGMGILTINQVGAAGTFSDEEDEYDWDTFKPVINLGLKSFKESHPLGLGALANPTAILRYQDGFVLGKNETLEEFIHNKVNADASLNSKFLDHRAIAKAATDVKMEFSFDAETPSGKIIITLSSAQINGERGVVFETSVVSRIGTEDIEIEFLMDWAEDAHSLQSHSYDTLIRNDNN